MQRNRIKWRELNNETASQPVSPSVQQYVCTLISTSPVILIWYRQTRKQKLTIRPLPGCLSLASGYSSGCVAILYKLMVNQTYIVVVLSAAQDSIQYVKLKNQE